MDDEVGSGWVEEEVEEEVGSGWVEDEVDEEVGSGWVDDEVEEEVGSGWVDDEVDEVVGSGVVRRLTVYSHSSLEAFEGWTVTVICWPLSALTEMVCLALPELTLPFFFSPVALFSRTTLRLTLFLVVRRARSMSIFSLRSGV